jgi:hypothetical protein
MALTPAQQRAAELARIKAENEARKTRGTPTPTPTPTPAPVQVSAPTPAPTPAPTQTTAMPGALTQAEMRIYGVTPEVASAPAVVQPTPVTPQATGPALTQADIDEIFGRGSGVQLPASRADVISSIVTDVYPPFGTVIGYEYAPGKNNSNSQIRRPKIADGKGGFVYGPAEQNPEYDAGSEGAGGTGSLPGSGAVGEAGGRSLSVDAFRNTLALILGKEEADKPYIAELYRLASGYFKTGSTVEESMNLALREARTKNAIPEFTDRFKPIFALEEMRRKGIAVEVPTIAGLIKAQQQLGEQLRGAGLGELANEKFLNDVLSTGKSVLESTNIIRDAFNAIDNAPMEWKRMVSERIPFADRTTLAKALLTGEAGAQELERKVQSIGLEAQAQLQGVNLTQPQAQELFAKGFRYGTSGTQFGQARQIMGRGSFLRSLTGEAPITQEQAFSAVFDRASGELESLAKLEEAERLRFQGRSGAARFSSQQRGRGGQGLF